MIAVHKPPPADWPYLERKVVKLGFYDLQIACGGSLASTLLGYHRFACAHINFDTMTCTKYYAADDEYGLLALEHEEDHCMGKDHVGSDELATWWANWKAQNPNWQIGMSSLINLQNRSALK